MINPVQESDAADVAELMQAMRTESGHPAPIKSEVAAASVRSWISNGTGLGFLARGDDGSATGVIFGMVTPDWLCGDLTAAVMVWYARPKERRGAQLIQRFLKAAKDRGAARVMAGTMLAFKNARLSALFDRLGFSQLETWWIRNF